VKRRVKRTCDFGQLELRWDSPANSNGGVVYFLAAPSVDLVKIGFSLDVKDRLRKLSTGSAVVTQLLKTIPGTRQDEATLHRRFKAYRVRGEWFKLAPIRLEIEAMRGVDLDIPGCQDCGFTLARHRFKRCRVCELRRRRPNRVGQGHPEEAHVTAVRSAKAMPWLGRVTDRGGAGTRGGLNKNQAIFGKKACSGRVCLM